MEGFDEISLLSFLEFLFILKHWDSKDVTTRESETTKTNTKADFSQFTWTKTHRKIMLTQRSAFLKSGSCFWYKNSGFKIDKLKKKNGCKKMCFFFSWRMQKKKEGGHRNVRRTRKGEKRHAEVRMLAKRPRIRPRNAASRSRPPPELTARKSNETTKH